MIAKILSTWKPLALAAALNLAACANTPTSVAGELGDKLASGFDEMHRQSEIWYDGGGHWGEKTFGYRMMLRDSALRLEAYGALAVSPSSPALYAQRADEAAAFLVSAQTAGGTGCFGIPADTGNPEFGRRIRDILASYPSSATGGYIVALPDAYAPELYYDHGLALSALARAWLRRPDASVRAAVVRGADWSLDKPLTANVNYLSTLAKGLATAYRVTNDARWLDRALALHVQSVFPHQAASGDWDDKHNFLLRYHGFIVSGLIALRKVLPAAHPDSKRLDTVLDLAVKRMAERDLAEIPGEDPWPGTNLAAWLELEELRALTPDETKARDVCAKYALRAWDAFRSKKGYAAQKACYSFFVTGALLAARTP